MELNMTNSSNEDNNKLSVRMAFFSWLLCAMLGWAFAITLFVNVITEDETSLIAQNGPTTEDAQKMQQILPAAGSNVQ